MSRFTLWVLSLSILQSGIQCRRLGKNSNTGTNVLPNSEIDNWRRNFEFSSENKVLANPTNRIERSINVTSKRQAKFLPKFSILAGLDIGGGLAAKATSNLSSLAKITQANDSPGIFNPYIAASYDPFPTSAVHQSIQTLYKLVEQLREQVDNFTRQTNNSMPLSFSSEDLNDNLFDDRNRRKQKLKMKKSVPKRKKQEKLEDDYDEEKEEEDEEEEETYYIDEKPVKKVSRIRAKTNSNGRQQVVPTTTSTDDSLEVTTTPMTNSTQVNNTNDIPGWYYGGNPQSIGNVSLINNRPQDSYGPPYFNYGGPYSYGPPSYSYGVPSQTYNSPSYSYGPPTRSYGAPNELTHYSAFRDSDPVVFDDFSDNFFVSSPSQRWQQRLPFARSQKLETSTVAPIIANSNGFVPML